MTSAQLNLLAKARQSLAAAKLMLGASQFCKKHFFYCSASVPARVLYNTRAGTLAL